jgi:transposase
LHLTALRASQHELEAALAAERRKRVRKRLVAINAILNGKSIQEAAHAANITQQTAERCLRRVHQSGLQSLLRDRRRKRPKWPMTPGQRVAARRGIASALARPLKPEVRTRLAAVDGVLAGRSIEDAAASARVLPATVRSWLRLVARNGVIRALARWERKDQPRHAQLGADPADLRDLAATEKKQPLRRQMLALALVAEGASPHAAALAAAADYGAVRRRVRRFRNEGIAAFRDKERWTRKLAADQIEQLRAEVLKRPDVHYEQLREFIQARFGVTYSCDGLHLLLKRDLGMVRRAGRFIEVAAVRCLAAQIRAALAPPIADRRQPEANPIPVRIFGASGHNEP